MGTLVFQATLGGAINLIGPNTASTVNFTLPSADGSSGQAVSTNGSGVLSFGTLAVGAGGTGQTSYTNGQLLIGNTTGNTLTKATLTAGSGITITNGSGAITIASSGGSGDVVGPASATDNAFTRFDGTTGKLVQNSTSATLSDDGTAFFKALSIDGSTNTMVFGSGAKIQMQTPTASANWFFETAGTNLTVSSAQSGLFNIYNGSAATTFGVGGATPSTSGSGITFPATQSASTNANTLDDYEEGTWTPNVGGNATYANQAGKYTKIGNYVHLLANIQITTIGTGSATAISGAPFTPNQPSTMNVGYFASLATSVIALSGYINSSNSTVVFTSTNGSVTTNTNVTAVLGSGSDITFNTSYFV